MVSVVLLEGGLLVIELMLCMLIVMEVLVMFKCELLDVVVGVGMVLIVE